MQKLVGAGNYVTGVSQDANGGLVFTMSNGTPITIGNVINGEKVEAGDKVTFDEATGEILLNGKATGKFVSKTQAGKPGEVKVPFVKDGVLYVYNEAGEAEATGIRVNPITAVQNPETGSWTLTITAADGTKQEIKLPSANDLVSSITIVKFANDDAAWLTANMPSGDATKGSVPMAWAAAAGGPLTDVNKKALAAKGTVISPLNADGTRGTYVDIQVTPSNIDVKDLKIQLQNSLGKTIWANGVIAENNEALTRANGVYRVYFTLAEGITKDNITKGDIVSSKHHLAVVCGNVSSAFDKTTVILPYDATPASSTPNFDAVNAAANVTFNSNVYVKLGESYNVFGAGLDNDPVTTAAGTLKAKTFFQAAKGLTSAKLELVTPEHKEAYGVEIDGLNFKITNPKAYKTAIPFKLVYTDNTIVNGAAPKESSSFTITVQSAPMTQSVTIKASHLLTVATENNANQVFFPIEAITNSLSTEDKIAWNESNAPTVIATAQTYNQLNTAVGSPDVVELSSTKKVANNPLVLKEGTASTTGMGAWSFVKADKSSAATTIREAAFIKFEINPATANVIADTYTALVDFTYSTSKHVRANFELTLTNPKTISRIPAFFDGDNVVAYGRIDGGVKFDILSLYEQNNVISTKAIDASSYKFTKVEGFKPTDLDWVLNSNDLIIPATDFYTKTAQIEFSVPYFTGSTNNVFTDKIMIVAKSPIKEGTITLNKTVLDLTAGTENAFTFRQSDVISKDVFGNAYNLFGVVTKSAGANPTYTFTEQAKAKIKNVTVVANTTLVDVKYVTTNADGSTTVPEETEKDSFTYSSDKFVGFNVKVSGDGAALQNGQEVKLTITVEDQWGQKTVKELTLNVKK